MKIRMKISKMTARMNNDAYVVRNCDWGDEQVSKVLELALTIDAEITVVLPDNNQAKEALGPLYFAQDDSQADEAISDVKIKNLSRRIKEFVDQGTTNLICHRLDKAGYIYIWQLCEQDMATFYTPDIGPKRRRDLQSLIVTLATHVPRPVVTSTTKSMFCRALKLS